MVPRNGAHRHLDAGTLADQALSIALFFACFVAKQAAVCAEDAYLDTYAYEHADELRQQLLRKVFVTKAQVVQDHGTGNVAAAMLEGVDQVQTYFRLILPKITAIALVPLVVLAFTLALDWVSALIMFVMFPFIVLYMVILGRNGEGEGRGSTARSRLSNHFIDTLRGVDTLKLFGAGKRYGTRIFEVSERFREATMRTLRSATLSSLVLDLFATLSIAAVAFMLGMRLLDGSAQLFPALAILVMVPEYFKPIRTFAADYHASLDGVNALKAIQGIVGAPDEPRATSTCPHGALRRVSSSSMQAAPTPTIGPSKAWTLSQKASGSTGSSARAAREEHARQPARRLHRPRQGAHRRGRHAPPDLKQDGWQRQIVYIPQDPYLSTRPCARTSRSTVPRRRAPRWIAPCRWSAWTTWWPSCRKAWTR